MAVGTQCTLSVTLLRQHRPPRIVSSQCRIPQNLEESTRKSEKFSPFARNLRRLRLGHGFTQEQLGIELGETLSVERSAVGAWEHDKSQPSIECLMRLGEIFNTSIDALVGNEVLTGAARLAVEGNLIALAEELRRAKNGIEQMLVKLDEIYRHAPASGTRSQEPTNGNEFPD